MMRSVYRFILWVHPLAFRHRFGDEMMSIFDESGHGCAAPTLLLDGLVSLVRQWLLRKGAWKLPVAMCGGFIQIFGSVYLKESSQSRAQSYQVFSPFQQELMVIALGVICILFIMVVSLTVWTFRFNRESRRMWLR